MEQHIAHITLVVKDYDEAILFYTEKLGFELLEDTQLQDGKRWVIIKPKGSGTCALVLGKAEGEIQIKAVGNQSGGRVFLFLHTDAFQKEYEAMKAKGVQFLEAPRKEAYGTVAVFKDLYGNLWDLLEPLKDN